MSRSQRTDAHQYVQMALSMAFDVHAFHRAAYVGGSYRAIAAFSRNRRD